MTTIIVYELGNGRILRTGTVPANMVALQAGPGESVMESTARDDTHYVDLSGAAPVITDRPVLEVAADPASVPADAASTIRIDGLPAGAQVSIDDMTYIVDDGVLEVAFDTPGRYRYRIEAFPYLDASGEVEAT